MSSHFDCQFLIISRNDENQDEAYPLSSTHPHHSVWNQAMFPHVLAPLFTTGSHRVSVSTQQKSDREKMGKDDLPAASKDLLHVAFLRHHRPLGDHLIER